MAGEGYQRQVRPTAGAPMPFARPEDYGAGIGRQLEQAGQAVHQARLQEYSVERKRVADEETATFQHGFAVAREAADEAARQARAAAAGGGAGHVEAMAKAWEDQRDTLLSGITDDSVRRQATAQFEESGLRFRSGEATWQEGKRVEKLVTDFDAARTIGANRVRRLDKPDDYTAELKLQVDAITALNVDDNTKQKLLDETEQMYAISFLRGRIDADPVFAKGLIASGAFDATLDPNQVEALLGNADVEIRSQVVAQAREAAAAKAQAKEEIDTLLEYDRQGTVIPDDQLAAAAAKAAELGDTSLSVKIDGIRANNAFAKVYEKATPIQREQRMTGLASKAKRSVDEDRELKWLQDHSGALDSEFDRDPVRALGKYGGAPAVDLNNAGSLRDRAKWARTQTAATGRYVPPLSIAETGPMRDLYKQGNAGKAQLFDLLDNFGAVDRVSVARMIAPEDTVFPELAPLPRTYRDRAIEGRAALKANAALLKSDDPDVEESVNNAMTAFGQATREMDSDQREALRSIAKDIMASYVAEGGAVGGRGMTTALQMALGARGSGAARTGGMRRWTGTDRWVLLPDGLTSSGFVSSIQRFVKANPATSPVNPDGSRLDLFKLTPVAIGGDWYEFRSASDHPAKRKDGSVFRLRIRPK